MSAHKWLGYGQKTALCLLAASGILVAGCSTTVKSGMFKSPFYGYSVALPSGWSGTEANSRWDGSSFPGFEDATVDVFGGPNGVRAFVVGQASGDDLAAYEKKTLQAQSAAHQCPTKPASERSVTLGGAPAHLLSMLCQGLHLQIAIVMHAKSGIVFTCDLGSATGADRTAVRRFLASVRLKG